MRTQVALLFLWSEIVSLCLSKQNVWPDKLRKVYCFKRLWTERNDWIWLHLFMNDETRPSRHIIRHCPACRTYLIATRFWVVVICPIIKCLTVLEFSFILFDLCLFITIFFFILNYVPIVTFWIFTFHKIWILLIIFCFIWNYWIIYF